MVWVALSLGSNIQKADLGYSLTHLARSDGKYRMRVF